MPRRCSVFGCRSNYDGEKAVSTFSLPSDKSQKLLWLKKIPTDFSKLKHPVICIKHFRQEDIITSDSPLVNGVPKTFQRKIPKLAKGALPCIFPNAPHYLSNTQTTTRRLIDVEEENIEVAIRNSLETHQEHVLKNAIRNFQDIELFLSNQFSDNWKIVKNQNVLILCLIIVKDDMPKIYGSVKILENLDFCVYVNNVIITKFPFIKSGKLEKLQSCKELEQVLNFIETSITSCNNKNVSESIIDSVTELLASYPNFEEQENLNFIVEQLKLSQLSPNNARYRDKTMVFSSTLYVHSPSAYNALRKSGFLFLPHPRNLQKLIRNFSFDENVTDGSSNSYLKMRFKYLKQHEQVVCLNIDEIYMQPRLCFKGGSVLGASAYDSSKIAKTSQVFMISAIFSKYRDVVCIVPVLNLTGLQLFELLSKILKEVEDIGFKVLAVVSDNNCVNRKAFELFTPNKILRPYIQHPNDPSRQLFFIFDTVHIFKCLRNNWLGKKDDNVSISFPDFEQHNIIYKAMFKHLENLYSIEKHSLVKYGHLLSYKVLYPSSIQKQNVQLVYKLFNEKNIAALKHVSKIYPNFNGVDETVKFLEVIINWWKIVNVKSKYEGERFNDKFREPVKAGQNLQTEYLQKMNIWLKNWRLSVLSSSALSPQTFQSLITTTEAFLELIPYVFRLYDCKYILLSKFQNDCLESRFSTYRQLSGSNYYISYTEILENEKKVRFRNVVIMSSEQLNVSLKTLIPSTENPEDVNILEFSDILSDAFLFESVPENLIPVLVYIGGFTTFKVLKESKCNICIHWIELDKEINITEEMYDFTLDIDRGKLKLPKKCVIVCIGIVWHVMNQIFKNFLGAFLKRSHQVSILLKLSSILLNRESNNFPFKDTCSCNRTLLSRLEHVLLIASKIFINNLVKCLNDKENINKSNDKRKIKKLC